MYGDYMDPLNPNYSDTEHFHNARNSRKITVHYVKILKTTPKAYLFLLSPGKTELWMPKTMIELASESASLPTQKKFIVSENFFDQCYKQAKEKQAQARKASISFDSIEEE